MNFKIKEEDFKKKKKKSSVPQDPWGISTFVQILLPLWVNLKEND